MTNEELDRWLAENVMGLKICDDPDCEGCDNPTVDEDGSIWLDREDYYRPEEWHPTTNIAQAIEAAMAWALKVHRTVIYEIVANKPHKLPDHHNRFGEAWWNDEDVIDFRCVFSAETDA